MSDNSPVQPVGTVVSSPQPLPDTNTRFNFAMLVGDVSCFYIAIAFLDSATALPALVRGLGGGEMALGILLALRQAGYFLPQPISAHLLQGRTRFQPFLLKVALFGRIWFFGAALLIWLYGNRQPGLALAAFGLAYVLSWFGDGMGGVPWTSLVGRTIPTDRRGRLFASTQVVAGISRLGVAVVVGLLLSGKIVGAPANLALLTLGCAVFLAISWFFLLAIREPAPTAEEREQASRVTVVPFWKYLGQLPGRFRDRPDMARLALVQLLAAATGATVPFLLTAAAPAGGMTGVLQAVQTLGFLLLAPVWGLLTDRSGPRRTMVAQMAVALLVPLAALTYLSPVVRGSSALGLAVLLLVYFCYGGVLDAWVTATNYLLEALSPEDQATYVGLMNAASAPSLLLPLGAGLLAVSIGKTALFWAAAGLLALGLALARSLPDTRQRLP